MYYGYVSLTLTNVVKRSAIRASVDKKKHTVYSSTVLRYLCTNQEVRSISPSRAKDYLLVQKKKYEYECEVSV